MSDLDALTVEHWLKKSLWPWPLALAYSLPSHTRHAALVAVTEILDRRDDDDDDVASFAGQIALSNVVAVAAGLRDGRIDHSELREIERAIVALVESKQVHAWGREARNSGLVAIAQTRWVGGEVDGERTCDLIDGGWRKRRNSLESLLADDRRVRLFDIHLDRDEMLQQFGSTAASTLQDRRPAGGENDDMLAEDYSVFEICEREGPKLRVGYWSPFTVLAWIASGGDEAFVASVQTFEDRNHANRGGAHSMASWHVLGNIAGHRYGCTFSDIADDTLRETLEANRLAGGIASDSSRTKIQEIQRMHWTLWRRSFENAGLSLLPGYVDFKWPSDAVMKAFPSHVESGDVQVIPRIPSGSAGAPTAKAAYLLIFAERKDGSMTLDTLQAEADAIATIYASDKRFPRTSGWPAAAPATVKNNIRDLYNQWKAHPK